MNSQPETPPGFSTTDERKCGVDSEVERVEVDHFAEALRGLVAFGSGAPDEGHFGLVWAEVTHQSYTDRMVNLLSSSQRKLTGIYIIQNTIDARVYVGSTGEGFQLRYKKHLSKLLVNKHHSPHLQNFFLKYGAETLTFEVLEIVSVPEGKTKKELRPLILEREQFYLDSFKCYSSELGFNCYKDAQSPLGLERSLETRLKISQARRERGIKHSPESLEKLREANRGEKNRMFGKTHTAQARQKISTKATGRRHTAETKGKMKERMTGESNPSYGKKMTGEHRVKLNSILSKKVICKMESGEVIKVYPSVTSTRLDGFDFTSVSKACLGKYGRRPTHRYRGFYWEFETSEHPF